MEWHGNLTMIMDEKKDTYSPGSIEAERYGPVEIKTMAITINSGDGKAKSIIQISLEDYKKLIIELMQKL